MVQTVEIVEVGPRDGLQDVPVILKTEQKLRMINGLIEAGIRRIEVTSFVSPRVVPQMADAEAVIGALMRRDDVTYIGLVLNKRGALRALGTSISQIGAAAVASNAFGQRNQGQTVRQSIREASEIVRLAQQHGRTAQVSIAAAFGCPFEGKVDPSVVVEIARELAESEPVEIAVADTIGTAVPAQVTELIGMLRESLPEMPIRAHFHDTRHTGLANVWAAVMAGADAIDASVGGLGGCPFAPDASGNVATEDVVYLFDQSEIDTGTDIQRILEVRDSVSQLLGGSDDSSAASLGRSPTKTRPPGTRASKSSGADHDALVEGPLSNVRVIEMGTLIAGPFCGQLLGDFGAEVIKIEPPGSGDPIRSWGTQTEGEGLWWSVIGRNKKSVTLDLRKREGQRLAARLISTADVVVENFRPGTLEAWNLGYDVLSKDNSKLVMARVSGFGQTGPYRERAGFGSIGEAMGGIRYVTGAPDQPPVRCGVSIGDSLTALFAALGITTALHARERTGRGQLIDAAIFESVLAVMENLVIEYDQAGYIRERSGSILPGVAPSNAYPCSDGKSILIGANGDRIFSRLALAMDQPALAEAGAFKTHEERASKQSELDKIICSWTRCRPSEDVLQLMHKHGIPAGPIYRAPEMLIDPHFLERQSIAEVTHPIRGVMRMQNVFPKLDDTPGRIRWPGPALGAHNEEIFCGILGLSSQELLTLQDLGVV